MIFLVEDDQALRGLLVEYLKATGLCVEAFERGEEALTAAQQTTPDVVLTDVNLPGLSGLALVSELGALDPSIVRVVMTAHGSIQTAVAAVRAGAREFVEKPVDLPHLAELLKRVERERRTQHELTWVRREGLNAIWGESAAMLRLKELIHTIAKIGLESPPVLILGETGVGKGLAARALHDARFADTCPWLDVNCAALPIALVEAELFGYERSAFTDAKQAKPGLFEAASGGSLFLDEVGGLPLEAQAKLLTVLESSSVRRLGAVRARPVLTAIIAASNVDLERASLEGTFRADLFHRLAALTIRVPPLRERGDDVLLLARVFLERAARRYHKQARIFSPSAERAIRSASWPGNVRELRFSVERAVLLASPAETTLDSLEISSGGPRPAATGAALVEGVRVTLPAQGVPFDDIEKAVLAEALKLAGGNVSAVAKLLSLSRDTVRYRFKKYGLDGG